MFTLLTLAEAEANLPEIVDQAAKVIQALDAPPASPYPSYLPAIHEPMRPLYKRIIESVTTRAKTLIDPAQQVTKKPVDVVAMASTTVTASSNWAKLQKVRVRGVSEFV